MKPKKALRRVQMQDISPNMIEMAKNALVLIRESESPTNIDRDQFMNLYWVLEAIYGDEFYGLADRIIEELHALTRFAKLDDISREAVVRAISRKMKNEARKEESP